ncbi:MAG: hypothetical protein IJE07_09990 [Clostridia bacterium]|nr:hypothetical protein [Clostridia bacterium]
MKRLWMLLLVLLAVAGTACAETMFIDGGAADEVHLRSSPVDSASSLGVYYTGTPVERLTATSGGWSRVRIGSQTGYVRTEHLAGEAQLAFRDCVVNNTTSDWVNLRQEDSFEATVLARLDNGTALQLMGETAVGWGYVLWNGQRGYVVTDFLTAAAPAPRQTPEASTAPAATVPAASPAPVAAGSSIVGTTADGGYIHAYDAGNGQTIYFVAMEADPFITLEDVNFDGRADIVVTTIRGATNCYYEFFVWTEAGYIRADHPGVEGIANYILHPQYGYVASSAKAGNAGALYEDCLMRWEGSSLRLVRRSTSEERREYRSEGTSFVIVMHSRQASLTVYAYTAEGDSTLLHEEIVDLNGMDAEMLEEMKQHLWEGLR